MRVVAMVGKTILHYQLLGPLGAGGMGEIYKAEDTRLHRPVAIKVLSPAMSADPERRKRFFQEAQAASALNHPNIITLYDIVPDGDTQCIVMEYIAGQTLRDVIPIGGLSPPQALQYATQIASALAAAHSAGIIHRDLKPSNIMVTRGGLIKLLDFGLAKWVDSGISGISGEPSEQPTVEAALTREGSIVGTVSYMSPEQAEGRRVDARSDIFSFGSVLYEMVTGKRAFEGRSGISTLSAILRDEVTPIYEHAPDVPPLLEQIILRCLMKDPAARWQTMKEVGGALLTLQRQLDPSGEFAAPVRTSAITPTEPSFSQTADTSAAPTVPAASAPPPARGAKNVPPGSPRVPRAVPAGPARAPAKPASTRFIISVLVLIGIVLVGSAAAGGWWWWTKMRRPATQSAAVITPTTPPAAIPAPAPAPEAAPTTPPPAATPVPEPPAAVPTPASPAPKPSPAGAKASSSKSAAKQKPKGSDGSAPAPAAAPESPAPSPAPAATAQPAPAPTRAPAPPPIAPSATSSQLTPVAVSDALPFVIILAQDVPADVPEGQALRFTALEGLQIGDKTVVAKGAIVTGAVTGETNKKKFLGIGGGRKLNFQLLQADAVDGKKLTVRAMAGRSEDGPTTRSFDTGKGSKSKGFAAMQGTQYIGYVDGDQTVSVRK
jgi:serine/threonine protein kinase